MKAGLGLMNLEGSPCPYPQTNFDAFQLRPHTLKKDTPPAYYLPIHCQVPAKLKSRGKTFSSYNIEGVDTVLVEHSAVVLRSRFALGHRF
jgi:hypothetical protein